MGYRSNVKILMSKKAYQLLENNCKNSDDESVRLMVEEPDSYDDSDDNFVLIGWSYVKWYRDYTDIKAVEDTLNQLDELVENDNELLRDYFYKIIRIGEDNATEEDTNDYDGEFTEYFYVECGFSM